MKTKLGTKILTLLAALVVSGVGFELIATGLSLDKIMLAARPVVEAVSVFSQILG
ncbi:MAG: hypothetical protein H5U07_05890 [Candidatus Aminicenantes bacterium]|nr:hypothetical protein [Candidatus Aminicenantes bacterium]